MRSFLTALLFLVAGPVWAADGFDITKIRAHLFYERTGTLSDDVLVTKPTFWNTVIGEGDVAEPASNVLVVVELKGAGGDASTETPLVIEVLADHDGWKRVARKSFNFLYTVPGRSPTIAHAVWAENVTCSPLRIIATHGPDKMQAEVPFRCGE